MIRKVFKWLGVALLVLLTIAAIFVAFNWTMVSNMRLVGTGITEVEKFQPREIVKGCPAAPLPVWGADNPLPARTFAAMKKISDAHQGVGMVVLVDGKVAGLAYRKGDGPDTRTLSQSMHKTVVALAIGAAIEDGVIKSLDDPVGNYIDEWKNDARGRIPLRAFLTMSSGVYNPSMASRELDAFKLNLSDEVSDTALRQEPEVPPFTEFSYKNLDTQIAGIALSRALGRAGKGRYADYLSKRIWCPIGAGQALLWLEREGGDPRFASNLDTRLTDWARVGELIRNQGRAGDAQVLTANWIGLMTSPSQTNPQYGFFTWRGTPWMKVRRYSTKWPFSVRHSAPYLADDVYFADGYGGQRLYIVPSAGLVIARTGEVDLTWDDALLVNEALRGLGQSSPSSSPS